MPIDSALTATRPATHPMAARRILRLAFGTGLSLWFSQAVAWQLSFIAPVLTMFILALPLPAPGLKKGIIFVFALILPLVAATVFLPFLWHARWAGIGLVALAFYYTFYFTARGGSPAIGAFMTVGLTLTVTVGTVNSTMMVFLIQAMAKCAVFGIAFVWIAYALFPDLPPDPSLTPRKPPPKPPPPPLSVARWNALRALIIVFPLALIFMFMSGSTSYTVVMIKVASMGQQATADSSKEMASSLMESTLWGGLGAWIGWTLLSAWPSLVFYTLLVVLAGLLFGRGIFQGPAVGPKFSMWSYAFLTAIVILAPSLQDTQGGSEGMIFTRIFLFILVAIYGVTAVKVFDAFFPGRASQAS